MEGTHARDPRSTIVGGASLDTPERARAYVASAQRDLNLHLRRLGSPTLLAVDGEWDADTQLAFERVCRILGIEAVRRNRTFRLIAAVGGRPHRRRAGAGEDGRRRVRAAAQGAVRGGRRREAARVAQASADRGRRQVAAQAAARERLRGRAPARPQPPPRRRSARRPCSPSTAAGTTRPTSRSGASAACSGSRPSATVRAFRVISGRGRAADRRRARARRRGRGDLRGGAAPPLRARSGARKPVEARKPTARPTSRTAARTSRPRCAPPARATRTRSSARRAATACRSRSCAR